jgi:hypothetical protein
VYKEYFLFLWRQLIYVQRPNLKEATLFPTLLSLANSKLNGKIADKKTYFSRLFLSWCFVLGLDECDFSKKKIKKVITGFRG